MFIHCTHLLEKCSRRGLRIHQQRTGAVALVPGADRCGRFPHGADAGLAHFGLDVGQRVAEGKCLRLGKAVLQRQILSLSTPPQEPRKGAMKSSAWVRVSP